LKRIKDKGLRLMLRNMDFTLFPPLAALEVVVLEFGLGLGGGCVGLVGTSWEEDFV
jgi:hypothetical protein